MPKEHWSFLPVFSFWEKDQVGLRVPWTELLSVSRKNTEEENEKLQLQLQHAQKTEAVDTKAGGIAHDLNDLLQVMKGYVQIMLTRKKPVDLLVNFIVWKKWSSESDRL